jgi:hypothetical protein
MTVKKNNGLKVHYNIFYYSSNYKNYILKI